MKSSIVTTAAALALASAVDSASASFMETFDSFDAWTYATAEKYAGKFVIEKTLEGSDNTGLKVTKSAMHYGAGTLLPAPLDPSKGKTVLQYELKSAEPLECGGAYMKFITADKGFDPARLEDGTAYTVMFGPDVCGLTDKVHLIIRYQNPATKEIEEKHLAAPPTVLKQPNVTHVYTAVLDADANTYSVLIDGKESKQGSLFEDFYPAFIAPETIPDETDVKPEDWVDDAQIPDPKATKPDDWDEDAPAMIPDPEATMPAGWLEDEAKMVDDKEAIKPDDWEEDEDGTWEPPQVPNPKCADVPGCGPWKAPLKPNPDFKGKWSAALIDNPDFKGVWEPRKIPNPAYVDDKSPLSHIGKIGGVAIEIWTMDKDYYFDNLLVTSDVAEAEKAREELWRPKYDVEVAAFEAKQKEEEEKRAKAEADEANKGKGMVAMVESSFLDLLDGIFYSRFMAPYADSPVVAKVYDTLAENAMMGVAGISAILALILASVVYPKVNKAVEKEVEKAKVGAAKKKDVTVTKDDDEKEKEKEEEEEEEEDVSPTRRSRRTTRRD